MKRSGHLGEEAKLAHELLANLASSELLLASVFLALADTASRNSDEDKRAEALESALSRYSTASRQLAELGPEYRGTVERELLRVEQQLQAAFLEEV